MANRDPGDDGAGVSPSSPADEAPQTLDEAMRRDDPDSPGAVIAREDDASRAGEVPEPNEPA